MDTLTLVAQNIKCGGCASAIQKGLGELENITDVEVNIDSGAVSITGQNLSTEQLSDKLAELGYPVS